jgi:hypothetical protein
LVYFMATNYTFWLYWYIWWLLTIPFGYIGIFAGFGKLCRPKSGNPGYRGRAGLDKKAPGKCICQTLMLFHSKLLKIARNECNRLVRCIYLIIEYYKNPI